MTRKVESLDQYTKQVVAYGMNVATDLYLLVRPDTDFDSEFLAWDQEDEEFIRVRGWLFNIEAV